MVDDADLTKWPTMIDIDSKSNPLPDWDPSKTTDSLLGIYIYVEGHASAAIDWYYREKKKKKRRSILLRYAAIVCSGLGGLTPFFVAILPISADDKVQLNPAGAVFFGLAGLAVAFDRFSGSSTSWMRYLSAALALENIVEGLRMDRTQLLAELGKGPLSAVVLTKQLEALRATDLAIRSVVREETNQWIAAFQTDLAQLEQQTRDATHAAREETRKAVEEERERTGQTLTIIETARDAQRPGGVNLTVVSAGKLPQGYNVQVDGRPYREHVTGLTCGVVNLLPGLHEVCVAASSEAGPLQVSVVVKVDPGAIAEVALELVPQAS